MKTFLFLCCTLFFFSCNSNKRLNQTLDLAGENRKELLKTLERYKNDSLKYNAAYFLIENMGNKHYYTGKIIDRYDLIFHLYDSLQQNRIYKADHTIILSAWDSLTNKYGTLSTRKMDIQLDCRTLQSDFLIENIDLAFESWRSDFTFLDKSYETFREFILPYRTGNEYPENFRRKYFEDLRNSLDTVSKTDTIGLLDFFHQEFRRKRNFWVSPVLWHYPISIPVSKMELGRRGACRHNTVYCAWAMRACGLPVAIDYVKNWGNRNQGHEWNVLLLDSGNIYPFDAFENSKFSFAYKPTKIFRKKFSNQFATKAMPTSDDVPPYLLCADEMDVTHEYGKTYDIEIECSYKYASTKEKKHGVICVFDNATWKPVFWGEISKNKMKFSNMMGDVCYMAAYYEKGEIIPATDPFVLKEDGTIQAFAVDKSNKKNMVLKRKYPRFPRIESFSRSLRFSLFQGANEPNFNHPYNLFKLKEFPFDVTDSIIDISEKFRYVRWKLHDPYDSHLAEIEFYGKQSLDDLEEVKLYGETFGFPSTSSNDNHSYIYAMDGDPATYFSKGKEQLGYVGLDLGKNNEHYITRVRFWPRSDTNFILIGDTYELYYWDKGEWKPLNKVVAKDLTITFEEVPQNTIYILRNRTKGKEERIFTYEDGKQVWW